MRKRWIIHTGCFGLKPCNRSAFEPGSEERRAHKTSMLATAWFKINGEREQRESRGMWTGRDGDTESERWDRISDCAVLCCAVCFPSAKTLKLFFPICANNYHPHINNKNPKECPEKRSGMNENENREQAYRMEGIALIDRHLEVSLELIKCCYLWGRRKEGSILLKHTITGNNLLLLWIASTYVF